MSRYIDADALIDFFNNIQEELGEYRMSFKAVNRSIDARPTIEPKRGEWIWDEQILGLVCSECKELGVERSNFCPNCGARMKGADDE